MLEVTALAIGAAGLLKVRYTLFGFVLVIGLLVLPQLLHTVCELAFVVVLAVASLKVVPAEFVLEFAIVGESLLDFLVALRAEVREFGHPHRLVVAYCYHQSLFTILTIMIISNQVLSFISTWD